MLLRFLYASFAVGAFTGASALLFPRTGEHQPPCVYPYTEFVYSGCYMDSVSSRSLPFQTKSEFTNATVEQCTSYCKGNNYRYAGLEYYGEFILQIYDASHLHGRRTMFLWRQRLQPCSS
jgi:hypothetical protein